MENTHWLDILFPLQILFWATVVSRDQILAAKEAAGNVNGLRKDIEGEGEGDDDGYAGSDDEDIDVR